VQTERRNEEQKEEERRKKKEKIRRKEKIRKNEEGCTVFIKERDKIFRMKLSNET
jgi:hypothetical protein